MTDVNECLKRAFSVLCTPNAYGYALGAQGERLKDLSAKIQYYYKMTITEYARTYGYNPNTIMFDCSGFVNYCFGKSRDWSSRTYYDMAKTCNTKLNEGVAGSVLWKNGHVGIDIGHGYVLEFKNEGCHPSVSEISERDFLVTIKLEGYDYSNVNNK